MCIIVLKTVLCLGKEKGGFMSNALGRKSVQSVYGFLCTKVCFLPLTLENLNKVEFIPKKDYNLNRLNTGRNFSEIS